MIEQEEPKVEEVEEHECDENCEHEHEHEHGVLLDEAFQNVL